MIVVKLISSICLMCTLAIAVPSYKFRDSKISRIQPFVAAVETAPSSPSSSSTPSELAALRGENDATIKYYHANKVLDKNHAHKLGLDGKKKSLTNHDILKSLGLSKIKTPPGHHRKRLAVESSRHHTRPDDSHMFIIKLPPNPYYYANTNTAQNKNGIDDKNQKIASMGFKSNGKPGRIYHWNLPVLKKMLTKGDATHRKSSNLRHSNDVNELIDIKNIPTWTNPWDDVDNNDTIEKAFGKQHRGNTNQISVSGIDDDLNLKLYKKKSPTYYAPAKLKKKVATAVAANAASAAIDGQSSAKYFPGNGKPKSFYVIKKNQHKPFYQKLIP